MLSNNQQATVLFFLHRIGPYHHARFQSVNSLHLIAVETRPGSEEYPWQFKAEGSYEIESFKTENQEHGLRGETLTKAIHQLFEKHNPHVVVTTGWADPEYHAVVLAARERKTACVIISDSRYEDEPRVFYKEWLKKYILKSYTSAIVAGTSSSDYLIRLGFNSEAIFQPWDVVDNDHFWQQESNVIGFAQRDFICVSRFIEKKNIERLINAFAIYRTAGGKRNLKLVGSGVLEQTLRKKVFEQEIEKYVHFEGFIQYKELPTYLNRGLCLILPSTTDQWGLVVNEAMASGLPVLVSNQCGCAKDLVTSKATGFTFDPFDEQEIVKSMMKLDRLTEQEWATMSKSSRMEIDNWNLSKFASALNEATQYAMSRYTSKGFRIVHFLLSK